MPAAAVGSEEMPGGPPIEGVGGRKALAPPQVFGGIPGRAVSRQQTTKPRTERNRARAASSARPQRIHCLAGTLLSIQVFRCPAKSTSLVKAGIGGTMRER